MGWLIDDQFSRELESFYELMSSNLVFAESYTSVFTAREEKGECKFSVPKLKLLNLALMRWLDSWLVQLEMDVTIVSWINPSCKTVHANARVSGPSY